MTTMKRITVSLPDEMVAILDVMKTSAKFRDRPYSELLRAMIQIGLEQSEGGKHVRA